jgi:Tol biopolymer transport system component
VFLEFADNGDRIPAENRVRVFDAFFTTTGGSLALSVVETGKQSIWIYDLRRESRYRLTPNNEPEFLPTWSPDGEFIAFRSGNTLAWT